MREDTASPWPCWSPSGRRPGGPAVRPPARTPRPSDEILALRETAWRSWFANDRAAFQRVVPDELVALGWGGGPWEDRAETMVQMGEFAKGGWTLAVLEFPRTVFQQYGDVVILYTRFRVVLTDGAGKSETTTGRGTEIFVRRKGHSVHAGSRLDAVEDWAGTVEASHHRSPLGRAPRGAPRCRVFLRRRCRGAVERRGPSLSRIMPRVLPASEHLIPSSHVLLAGRCFGGLAGEDAGGDGPGRRDRLPAR